MREYYSDGLVTILHGDCREFDGKADVILTDPPYGLEFMGKEWDKLWVRGDRIPASKRTDGRTVGAMQLQRPSYRAGIEAQEWHRSWCEALLGKAGWLFAFGGTRTWHRLACAIEDSGWQIRDTMMWLYGQGFPKGKNNLKPAWEPIIVARKYGDLDIEAGRIGTEQTVTIRSGGSGKYGVYGADERVFQRVNQGRWPANLILDEEAGWLLDEQSGLECGAFAPVRRGHDGKSNGIYGDFAHKGDDGATFYADTGGASRFFYCAKASRSERGEGNDHPTVKPLKLMEYLVNLSGGQTILDPFMGSGTTLVAAKRLGRKAIGIEIDEHSCEIAARRCQAAGLPLMEVAHA